VIDIPLLLTAAIAGAFVSLAISSLALSFDGRLGGVAILLIVVGAIALPMWLQVDWPVVSQALSANATRLGTIAAGGVAGAIVGVILPLILSAIANRDREEFY
jgi:hypothetical protein